MSRKKTCEWSLNPASRVTQRRALGGVRAIRRNQSALWGCLKRPLLLRLVAKMDRHMANFIGQPSPIVRLSRRER